MTSVTHHPSDPVITGIGVVAPTGVGLDEHWASVLAAENLVGPIDRFDASYYRNHIAGEIRLDAEDARIPPQLARQTDRMTRLSLVGSELALTDAKLDPGEADEYAVGVAMTSSAGGLEFGQHELQKLWSEGWEAVSTYMSFAWFYAVHAGQTSIRNGLRGPGGVVVSEQAGGLDCLSVARRRIRQGTPYVVSGAIDGSLCPYGLAIQAADDDLSLRSDPDRAYLPFDADAAGYVVGEGGAILVVEDRQEAADRGAPQIYASIAGWGAAFDPSPHTSGAGLRRAVLTALDDAGLEPGDIDVVLADGAGVPALDRTEADVLSGLFGPCGVPVSVPKAGYGRLMAGGAPLDVATAVMAMRDDLVPPMRAASPASLDPRLDIPQGYPRPQQLDTALVLARGHGGFASAMVLRSA